MRLSRQDILEKLKEIMLSIGSNDKEAVQNAVESTRLTDDLGLTSVGMLYLVIVIEESFSVRFDDVGIAGFTTVGDVVDYIESKSL